VKRRENLKQLFGKQPLWYPRRVPRMKLIIKQFSPTTSICFLLCPYSPSALYSRKLQFIFFPQRDTPNTVSIKTNI
jgi:hypothetical protein